MLTDRERIPLLVASTKLEKGLRAMSMKERLEIHRQIERENERKLKLWKRFNYAEGCLGFRPSSVFELEMYESNGYDDAIFMYR